MKELWSRMWSPEAVGGVAADLCRRKGPTDKTTMGRVRIAPHLANDILWRHIFVAMRGQTPYSAGAWSAYTRACLAESDWLEARCRRRHHAITSTRTQHDAASRARGGAGAHPGPSDYGRPWSRSSGALGRRRGHRQTRAMRRCWSAARAAGTHAFFGRSFDQYTAVPFLPFAELFAAMLADAPSGACGPNRTRWPELARMSFQTSAIFRAA